MKKALFLFALVLIATSCSKWKKDTKQYTYYSENYAETDMDLLGVHTGNIEKLYVVMYNDIEDKNNYPETYKLCVESEGAVHTESGTIDSDWATSISFIPTDGTAYTGGFQQDKGTYKLLYELENRTEELTFVWKDKCK